eukprot:1161258-Pelagomonas_calceolata.AAC.6
MSFAGPACWVAGMVGWRAQQALPSKKFPKIFCSASHCLPRPLDTAGLLRNFIWEGSQTFRAGGALGAPGQPSVNFTGKQANLGACAP